MSNCSHGYHHLEGCSECKAAKNGTHCSHGWAYGTYGCSICKEFGEGDFAGGGATIRKPKRQTKSETTK